MTSRVGGSFLANIALTAIRLRFRAFNCRFGMYSLAAKLDAVSKNLKKGGEAAELAVKRMNIGAAVNSWNDTAEWAKKIQDLASGTSVQPVLQHDSLVRAFR